MQLDQLVPGDVLIENNIHTMIYIGPSIGMAHAMVDAYAVAGQNGVAIVDMQAITDRIWKDCHVFRRDNTGIRMLAAEYARQWATNEIATKMAPERRKDSTRNIGAKYDNRRLGVQIELDRCKAGGAIPEFGYDALYRVFKWAHRRHAPFSENRGTTCCAFVIGCHQAASVCFHTTPHHVGAASRIRNAYEILQRNRSAKPPLSPASVSLTPSGSTISLGSQRSHSNAGFQGTARHGPDDARAFMKLWLDYLTDKPDMSFEDVFTPALLMDAKFVHSSILQSRLQDRVLSAGWAAPGQIEKKPVGKLKMSNFKL